MDRGRNASSKHNPIHFSEAGNSRGPGHRDSNSRMVIEALYKNCRDADGRMVTLDHNEAGLGNVIETAVLLLVVPDGGVGGDVDVLVEYRAADHGAAADVAIVQNHAVLDQRARVHFDAAAQHRIENLAAGENAATGNDRIDGLAAPVLFVEGELGRL